MFLKRRIQTYTRQTLIIVLTGVLFQGYAQNSASSWIDYNNTYYKIELAETGIYKLDFSDLSNAGISASSIDPEKLQLFYRGVEQSIYVEGEADSSFDSSDYIYFYGEKNDGKLDKELYTNANKQPHDYYSLITDTNAYFLCVGTAKGKRINKQNGSVLNGTAEHNHIKTEVKVYNNQYYYGRLIGVRSHRSDYTEAEGWFGNRMSKGNSYTYTVDLDAVDTGSNLGAQVNIGLYGASDNITSNGDNHHVKVSTSSNGSSWSQIADYKFKGYSNNTINTNISANAIGPNKVMFKVEVIDDLGVQADNSAIGYIEVTYPALYKSSRDVEQFQIIGSNASSGASRIKVEDYYGSQPLLFDLTNNSLISGVVANNSFEAMVPGAGVTKKALLVDSVNVFDAKLSLSSINSYSSTIDYNYLIITANVLKSAALQYSSYRASAVGGNYDVLLMSMDEVADQFFYGIKHPLAFRNILSHLFSTQSTNPQNMLLIGKAFNTELARNPQFFNLNLLPTMGATGSDNLISYNVNNQGFSPALNMGRISARTNQEVLNYLNKVQAYESRSPELWQKEIFGVSGGNNAAEMGIFRTYIDNFNTNYEKIKLGANTDQFDKNLNTPNVEDPKQMMIRRLNEGLLLYHYFGHGTIFNTAVDIGTPQEYSNTGKYPIMFFAGCNIGDAFEESSIGEDFISTANKGAIGWIAQSSLGYSLNLYDLGNIFSRRFATQNYGEPIGAIIRETLNEYENATDLNITHVQQQTYQGDPALKTYNSQNPDYTISNSDVAVEGQGNCGFVKGISLLLKVCNLGRSSTDSIEINITRSSSTGETINYGISRHPAVSASEIIKVALSGFEKRQNGTDTYTIALDPRNLISESNEGNNTVVYLFDNEVEKAIPALPKEYSIVSGQTAKLRVNNVNRTASGSNYDIEIDTTWAFNSPYKKNYTVADIDGAAQKTVNLLIKDSTVYYWRTKLTTQSSWCTSSFTRISGTSTGWNQSNSGQLLSAQKNNLEFDIHTGRFDFARNYLKITSRMNRFLTPAYNLGIRQDNILFSGGSSCGSLVRVARFDRRSLEPHSYVACNTRKSKPISVQSASGRTELKNFIRSLPTGEHFSLTSILGGAQYLTMDSIPHYLEMVGGTSNTISSLVNNSAYTIVGEKGMSAGTASEGTSLSQTNNSEPIANAGSLVHGFWFRGSAKSEVIGPAGAWNTLTYDLAEYGNTDLALISVYGIDGAGNETTLVSNSTNNSIQLSTLASGYPYLRIHTKFEDMTMRNPAQLRRWTVTYSETAETAIVADSSYQFPPNSAVLRVGDTLKIAATLKNLSTIASDSMVVKYYLNNSGAGEQLIGSQTLAPISAGSSSSTTLHYVLNSAFNGRNNVLISALPKSEWKEENKSDNYLVDQFQSHAGAATPVELLFFTGKLVENNIAKLEWETRTELNNDRFELERRLFEEGEYKTIGVVGGAGTSNEKNRYNYADNLSLEANGLYVYRLKQVDFDGTFDYSSEILIRKNADLTNGIRLFPNPTTNVSTLEFWQDEGLTATIEVYDVQGREMLKEKLTSPGMGRTHNVTIQHNGQNLAPGSYLVKISLGVEITIKILEVVR